MYSSKNNILQLTALLRDFGIDHVVLCPGSRNAAIVQTLATCPDFKCFSVVDERSAAFFALGLIQELKRPVAICCTSGTALLNFGSAVAEAFYQQLPLLVISSDRPSSWIGQMDGQTIPQPNIFGSLVKKSVHLPEPEKAEDEWYCNRLINEALLALTHHGWGPVHINIPISEPLFEFTTNALPNVRKITRTEASVVLLNEELIQEWKQAKRPMIIIGQQFQNPQLADVLNKLSASKATVVLAEQLANLPINNYFISNFDSVLYANDGDGFVPDLVITIGGHIVSKRLKSLLRKFHPQAHWHIAMNGEMPDLYQSLTQVIESSPLSFLTQLVEIDKENDTTYFNCWKENSRTIAQKATSFNDDRFSDIHVVNKFLQQMPEGCALQLGNSSTVRNVQLFNLPTNTTVYCNRGTNGIDGSVSTAVGFAAIRQEPTYLIVGDLSFFYDMNALWNAHLSPFLRILLINNEGGEIFHLLPGLNKADTLQQYVAASHHTSAGGWAKERGFVYLQAENDVQLQDALKQFTQPDYAAPILLEVKTNSQVTAEVFKAYYHHLK